MPDYYILDEEHHVQPATLMQWALFFGTHHKRRIVEQTMLNDIVLVSTVFIGIRLNFGGGPPLLFETMVFDLVMDGGGDQWRYASWDDAEIGHKAMVRRIKAQLAKIEMPVLPGD